MDINVFMKGIYPINVLNAVKNLPEVCRNEYGTPHERAGGLAVASLRAASTPNRRNRPWSA